MQSLVIATSPQKLYQAITTQEGLQHWWTQQVIIHPQVGTIATFRFDKSDYVVMKIAKLIPNKEVIWKCVEQHFVHSKTEITDDWVGTTVKFEITVTKEKATVLTFTHDGLTPQLPSYEESRKGWDQCLKSLHAYSETGTGTPFTVGRKSSK